MSDCLKQMHLSCSNRRFIPWLVIFAVFIGWSNLRAQSTTWNATTTADWFAPTNWTNGVPNLSSNVYFETYYVPVYGVFGGFEGYSYYGYGTAVINGARAQAGNLFLTDYSGYTTSINIIGGGALEVSNFLEVYPGCSINGSDGVTHIDAGGAVYNYNSGYISGLSGLELGGGGTVTNYGTIAGTSGVAIDTTGAGANTVSNDGYINGSVNLGNGPNTVSNAGNISGSVNLGNGTNTVTLITGGSINGSLNLGTNSGSTLVLDGSNQQSLSQAVTGTITNPGSLTKQGTGTWIIDENLNAPVATNVNLGTLTVNQTLDTGALTVAAGATLNGSGIAQIDAGGTVANSGTISGLSGLELNGGGRVTNNAGGSIQGSTSAPVQWPYNGGVTISTGTVTNAGTISGENGVVFTGGGSVTNQAGGVIQGIALNDNGYDSNTGSGIYAFANNIPVTIVNKANATIEGTGTYSWGIHTGSTPISVDNYGLISGNVDGINNNGDSQIINEQGGWITSSMESAIATTNGSNTLITNSGNILSTATDKSPAIAMFYGGTINNNAGGVITGQDGNAIGIGYQGDTGPTTLSNSGTINGNVTLADQPNTFSNAGIINGAVNLGNGANTARLITAGIISGDLNLGTNSGSALVLDGPGQQSLSQAVTGSITSPGSLTKTGTGTWTIDENLSARGSTEIKSGILKVNENDTLTTPTLTVDAQGTLGGAGTIATSNVINYGTIAPGDPQTLTIAGNYTQEAGGNLQIDIEGTGTSAYAYDVLLVTGTVTLLPDSVLTLDFLNGFDPVAGDTFDFLQPGGGLTGSFSQVMVEGLTNGLKALLQSDGSNGYEIAMVNPTTTVPDSGYTFTLLLIGVLALIGGNYILQAGRKKQVQLAH